jgi:acetyl-CoA carboxylase carboxyl transferase subunit alpha
MNLTATRLRSLGFVDELVEEPLGGAHRDMDVMADSLRKALLRQLKKLRTLDHDSLLNRRYERLMSYGNTQPIA